MRRAVVAFALLILGACAGRGPVPAPAGPAAIIEIEPFKEWEQIVTAADQAGIAALPQRWALALAAIPRRSMTRLRAEGALAEPEAALAMPTPPPGPYHCRLVRFGGRSGIATFPPDFCYVETSEGRLSFTKQTGRNLPNGWLHEDTPTRHVLLGTMGPGRYGDVPGRDVAGVVERVSPFRWRLVLTRGGRGALLDVYELVPVTPEVPGAPRAVPAKEG